MAIVAVQQPGQRETQLDAVAKALNIAQSVYGIKTSYEQMKLMKQKEERAKKADFAELNRQDKLLGIQQGTFDIAKQKNDTEQAMLKTGSMTPKQFNDEYFEISKEDIPKYQRQFQGYLPIVNAKVWKYGAKEGENNYEERIAIDKSVFNKLLGTMADERKTQMLINAKEPKTGKGGLNLTPGQEKIDKSFADLYDEWTSGGYAKYQKNVDLLERSKAAILEQKKDLIKTSGRFVGQAPNILRGELSKRIEADVRQSAQGALKATLGAAFGEKEGERIMKAAYDPTVSPEENLIKIQTALDEIYGSKRDLDAKIKYYEYAGTLQGYTFNPGRNNGATGGWGDKKQTNPLLPGNNQTKTTPTYNTQKGREAATAIGVE